MKISRFQLKLTAAFVGLLLIPTLILGWVGGKLLTRGLDLLVGQKVERALYRSLTMVQRMRHVEEEGIRSVLREIVERAEAGDPLKICLEEMRETYRLDSAEEIGDSEVFGRVFLGERRVSFDPWVVMHGDVLSGTIRLDSAKGGGVVVSRTLDPELIGGIADVSEALGIYRRMGSLRAQGRYVIVLASIGVVGLLIVLGAGAGVFVTRRITRPISALVEGTQEVARGNLSFRVEAEAKDEIGALIGSFNQMTEDLRSNREKLLQAERMAAWRDVARRIAHEIKNPLTPIELSMVRLGRRLDRSDEAYARLFDECSSAIRRQVESLRDMASEFSEFARMPEPKRTPCDLNGIVEEVLRLQGMEERNIVVHTDLTQALPTVMGDEDQLRRVLMNLMKNAVEAMPEGGTLRVSSASEGDWVRVGISDTGVGMPGETARKMFDPYFTTKRKGTGLGMAIVKGIIEGHGGGIEVESMEGEGTEVVVRVPWEEKDNCEL